MNRKSMFSTSSAVALLIATASPALAADHHFSIPAQDLASALRMFATQSGSGIVASEPLVAHRHGQTVQGRLDDGEALARLLAGSGLHAERIEGAFVIRPDKTSETGVGYSGKDIVVTGTRIRGAAPIGAPLTIIDRKAIEDSGRATVADYIQTLPQNFGGGPNEASYGNNPRASENASYGSSINLRGLGPQSTLVLFDGNRPALGGTVGSFVDTSLIPATAIDRIEVLTDGASAIYGTDAVAGVVNIRFRNRLDGFETSLYSGVASDGATSQFQVGQTAGKSWSSGSILLAYQYDHRGSLDGSDRRVATEDLRPFGGPDLRSGYAVPGTIIAANGQTFGIPPGQDGTELTPAQLIPGQQVRTDIRRSMDLLPRQDVHALYAAVDQSLFDGISVYARALYAHRRFVTTNNTTTQEPVSVPVTNPFYVDPIGTHQPVSVEYDFAADLGHYVEDGTLDALTTSGGFKGQFGPWHGELNASYGRQLEITDDHNQPSYRRVALALADPDPATALNVFGDGTANNPATLDFIRSTSHQRDRYTVWSTAVRLDGPLFALPAGSVKLAAGFEHRNESFSSLNLSNTNTPSPDRFTPFVTPGTPNSRHVDAVYGELSVPLLASETGGFPGHLDASVAGRVDWYSDVGRTANPKAGLSWTPSSGFRFQGSWGTSFRAPGFYENAGPAGNRYVPLYAPDPSSPTGQTPILAILGYAPVVKPEKARSWTAGIDFKPPQLPGLSLTANYFDIAFRDRIASPVTYYPQFLAQRSTYASLIDAPDPAQVAALYASPLFQNPYGIPASDIAAIFHLETQNLSRVAERGVDFDLGYGHDLLGGYGLIGIAGTRLIAIKQKLTATSDAIDVLGTFYNPVKWRLRGRFGWSRGGFSGNAFVNYTDGYLNNQVTPSEHVSSWTTVDAQIGYRFDKGSALAGLRLSLSATNLFNGKPPYVLNSVYGQTLAYDPSQANAIGRLISLRAALSW